MGQGRRPLQGSPEKMFVACSGLVPGNPIEVKTYCTALVCVCSYMRV